MKKITLLVLMLVTLGAALLQGCGGQTNAANDALMQAASKGDATAVQAALSQGADVNYKDKGSMDMTPLMVASSYGHSKVVKLLITNKADPTVTSGHVTALKLAQTPGASSKGREQEFKETIRLLEQAGATE